MTFLVIGTTSANAQEVSWEEAFERPEFRGVLGLYDKYAPSDPTHPLGSLTLAPFRDSYAFFFAPSETAFVRLSSELGKGTKAKVGEFHDQVPGGAASVRLKRNESQRFRIEVQRQRVESIFLKGGTTALAALGTGLVLQYTSVRPAVSSEVASILETGSPGERRATSGCELGSDCEEIGYRALFGESKSDLEELEKEERASAASLPKKYDALKVTFHHFGDSKPAVVQVYRPGSQKGNREWWSGHPGAEYEAIPMKVVRYISGFNDGQVGDLHGNTVATGDFGEIEVEPLSPLPPGEYAFVTFEIDEWFSGAFLMEGSIFRGIEPRVRFQCFGVDL
jgi:hypothetical protein